MVVGTEVRKRLQEPIVAFADVMAPRSQQGAAAAPPGQVLAPSS